LNEELDGQTRQALEQAALQGNRCAIEALWKMHRRWVAAVLLTYRPRSEDLDDLLQEVAMTLLTKIHSVREAGNIRAWLRTVAINIARAAGRAERSRAMRRLEREQCDALPATSADSRTAGHAGFDMDEEARRVMALCQTLPEGYREPLLLKAVQGMRTRQISEILNLPEATVDTRISRARRMLREQISPSEEHARTQSFPLIHDRVSASGLPGSFQSSVAARAVVAP
jgi:RNA polymerase sigma-70 factor (ECF subfamily)